MSFMKKVKASFGIGSAKIHTVFDVDTYEQGGMVTGKVFLQGGEVEQTINRISLDLMTHIIKEEDEHVTESEKTIVRYIVSNEFIIHEGEQKEISFTFRLPIETPVSMGEHDVWVRTRLDIPVAVDPKDYDYLRITAHPTLQTVWSALEHLGFSLCKAKNIPLLPSRLGIGQKLEFVNHGIYQRHLDELEFIPILTERGGDFLFEIDRKLRGVGGLLAEALEFNESKVQLSLSHQEAAEGVVLVKQKIENLLQQHL